MTYLGNSKVFIADELEKNWRCVLFHKRKPSGTKKRAGRNAGKNAEETPEKNAVEENPESTAAAAAATTESTDGEFIACPATSPRKRARSESDVEFPVICKMPYIKVLALIQARDMPKVSALAIAATTHVNAIKDPSGTFSHTRALHDTHPRHTPTAAGCRRIGFCGISRAFPSIPTTASTTHSPCRRLSPDCLLR